MHGDCHVSVSKVSMITVFLPSKPGLAPATLCVSGFAQYGCSVIMSL